MRNAAEVVQWGHVLAVQSHAEVEAGHRAVARVRAVACLQYSDNLAATDLLPCYQRRADRFEARDQPAGVTDGQHRAVDHHTGEMHGAVGRAIDGRPSDGWSSDGCPGRGRADNGDVDSTVSRAVRGGRGDVRPQQGSRRVDRPSPAGGCSRRRMGCRRRRCGGDHEGDREGQHHQHNDSPRSGGWQREQHPSMLAEAARDATPMGVSVQSVRSPKRWGSSAMIDDASRVFGVTTRAHYVLRR